MLSEHKLEVLRAVEASELPVRKVLDQLEIPCSTYYRWRHSFRQRGLAGLRDRPPGPRRVWNFGEHFDARILSYINKLNSTKPTIATTIFQRTDSIVLIINF